MKILRRLVGHLIRLEVTLVLKSGRQIVYTTDKVTTTRNGNGDLTSIKNEGTKGWPLYVRLDDVLAVLVRNVLR